MDSEPENDNDIGGIQLINLALRRGYITPEKLRDILAQRSKDAEKGRAPQALSLFLLSKGYVKEEELRNLLDELKTAAPPADDSADSEVPRLGKYALLKEIGRGSWGIVYEALDTSLGRNVALKLMRLDVNPDLPGAAEQEERFVREAMLAASIPKHPHLVTVYEAGVLEGKRFIAMELIQGYAMPVWQKMGTNLLRQVALLKDVALAVDHAHEHGVLHRDLKPTNILVDAKNEPHIGDFGTAKGLQSKARTSSSDVVMGTPGYISPEQVYGSKEVDRRADVYSLGVMLYEILTGHRPFEGRSAVETLTKALEAPLRPPSSVVPKGAPLTIDRTIEQVCLKALARKPRDRYPTARALAEDLNRWLTGQKVAVARASKIRLAWAAAVLAVLLGVAGWIFLAPAPKTLSDETGVEITPADPAPGARLRRAIPEGVRYESISYEGTRCVKLPRTGSLHLDLEDTWAAATVSAEVRVHYFDGPSGGHLRFAYDSTDPRFAQRGARKWAGTVWFTGANAWKMTKFPVTNPRFANRLPGGSDFQITGHDADLYVSRVSVQRTAVPSPKTGVAARPASADSAVLKSGLMGEYFKGEAFEHLVLRQVDAEIFFDWQEGACPGGPWDHFSARWTGFLRVPKTGRYVIETVCDDGVRVSVGGTEVISQWSGRSLCVDSVALDLEEGLHEFRLEYLEEYGVATIILSCLREEEGKLVPLGPDCFFHDPTRR